MVMFAGHRRLGRPRLTRRRFRRAVPDLDDVDPIASRQRMVVEEWRDGCLVTLGAFFLDQADHDVPPQGPHDPEVGLVKKMPGTSLFFPGPEDVTNT